MHERKIVHCDLKLSNIMCFGADCKWKIIDLEAARQNGKHKAVRFTYLYAAPEVIQWHRRGRGSIRVLPSQDTFSFGVIAFEILNTKGKTSSELFV